MILLAAVVALAVGAGAAGWLASCGPSRRLVDRPNERSLHDRPVSRAGGVAIFAGVAAGLATAALAGSAAFLAAPAPGYGWVLAGALVIAVVSFTDDVRRVSPAVRIVSHLAAAACVVLAGLPAERIVLPGAALHLGPAAGAVFTVLFVAWIVNLYNFMDGMDGFAGGMTAIGFATLAALCAGQGAPGLAAAVLVVAAAALGFLPFNFPPAKMFMGDLGSTLLGYLCAVAMLWAERSASVPAMGLRARILAVHRRCDGHPRAADRRGRAAVARASRPLLPAARAARVGASQDRRARVRPDARLRLLRRGGAPAPARRAGSAAAGCVGGRIRCYHVPGRTPRTGGRGLKIARSVTRLRSRSGAFAHDLLMIPVAWLGAFWLRFNLDSIPAGFLDQALRLLPVIVVIQSAAFLYFGLYRGVWRFASLPDLVRVLQAVVVGTVVCAFATFLMTPHGSRPPCFVSALRDIARLAPERTATRLPLDQGSVDRDEGLEGRSSSWAREKRERSLPAPCCATRLADTVRSASSTTIPGRRAATFAAFESSATAGRFPRSPNAPAPTSSPSRFRPRALCRCEDS